jgi:dipeptidase E
VLDREMRRQTIEENDVAVLGMREGSWLRRRGGDLRLGGTTGARLFVSGEEPREFEADDDLSFLLDRKPVFDSRV